MEERLMLDEEKKAQLLRRVKEALDDDILNKEDWMKIYGILVEACERGANEAFEEYMIHSVEGDIQ
jgi:hypothetical protein